MVTILTVDDSAVDRRLVGGLLEKEADFRIEYAAHGVEALEKLACETPDLVVTDLMMPRMNGLELVTAIRQQYPLVPVILMTSKGSEEIAVEALQRGAASYVPKRTLAERLLDTIRNVLAVSGGQRRRSQLMGCIARSELTFVLENDCDLFRPLVTHLQENVVDMGICDDTECTRIGVALEEALANALYHGNLEVGSELRGEDDRAYHALVKQRLGEPAYCDRRIRVEASLSRDRATFAICDEGLGFDPSTLPDPTDPANIERACGRGVLLMRTFMDDVIYNDVGNAVTLTKRGTS
ncbi:MAG: response regulator [Candidatus Nealsonbacteria bacterium]|nr:response regulator [Candidatus Nealsonbacteria bacterium]